MKALKSIPLYFLRHWRGELSLAISFWINIVALNLLVFGFIDPFIIPDPVIDLTFGTGPSFNPLDIHFQITEDPLPYCRFNFIWAVLKLAVLYPWQFVGLMRSCNRYVAEKKNKSIWGNPARLLAIIGIAGVTFNAIQHWEDYRGYYHLGFETIGYTDYKVELIKDDTFIHLKGAIGYGVSTAVANLLIQNPEIKGIILDSYGGLAREGYWLSDLVRLYDLDTYVLTACYSACTTVFISGKKRFLGRGAFLGFHQSSLIAPGAKNQGGSIWESNQNRITLFDMQGFSFEFLLKTLNASPDDMWYPAVSELIEEGVVHEVINPADFMPSIKIYLGMYLDTKNLRVLEVLPSSKAERMGFQKNDVLIQWDDVQLAGYEDWVDQREKFKFGDPYRIKIRRNNSILELEGVLQ